MDPIRLCFEIGRWTLARLRLIIEVEPIEIRVAFKRVGPILEC
jgi:hypothetical protein